MTFLILYLYLPFQKQQANLKEMLDKTSKQQDSVQKQKEEKEKELQVFIMRTYTFNVW